MSRRKSRIFEIPYENGYYLFKLEKVLENKNQSKYALAKALNSEYKVINRYARGDLSRFDASVIAKICDFCNCGIEDIIEYIPNKN